MNDDLPSSGEPGVRPPVPGSLPRPAMWPAGARETPFDGAEEDTTVPATPNRRKVAWVAVAVMVLGVSMVGLAFVTVSWQVALTGILIGAVGAALALKVRIMEDVE